jgi:ABC-type Mn2+/Zn2+ transport system ATPase subunit
MREGKMASRHQHHLDLLTPCRPLRELQRRHAQWQAHEATQQAEIRRQAVAAEKARVSAVSTLLSSTFASSAFGAAELQSLSVAHAALDARARVAADSLDLAQRAPMRLSIGQRKRVALATVLAMNPSILVFDEPSAGLDPRGRRELIELLQSLTQTLIVSTHDLELERAAFPRSIVVDRGAIVADGSTSEILANRELLLAHGLA